MTAPQILIVEDEAIIAAAIEREVRLIGYGVIGLTATGEGAIQLTREKKPDLVLMDIKLQGAVDGIEAGEVIYQTLGIPVIYLTAHTDEQTLHRAAQTNPFGYLVKPIKSAELRTTIEVALVKSADERKHLGWEAWLTSTIKSLGEAFLATDREGTVLLINTAAEALTGWTPVKAIGKPLSEILILRNEETRTPVEIDVDVLLALNRTLSLHKGTVCYSQEGKQTPIEGIVSPIRDELGNYGVAVLLHSSFTSETENNRPGKELPDVPQEENTRIVTICASCKKICKAPNQWMILEKYFSQRFDVAFSHGFCPECYATYRAQFLNRPQKESSSTGWSDQ